LTVKKPVPKTIALVGVAMGSIKEKLVARVRGIIR